MSAERRPPPAASAAAPPGRRPARLLLAAMWPVVLAHLAVPAAPLRWALIAGLSVYVVHALIHARWQTRLLVGILGLATVVLCAVFDSWSRIPDGLAKGSAFIAFLCTIVLLRATAEQRREIAAARALFAALDEGRRGGGVLVGAHMLGSVLIVGVFALLAPILGPDAPEAERRRIALSAMRGMNMAVLWSPFFVAMAVASHHLPRVPLWQIVPLGIGTAAVGLIFAYLRFERAGGLATLWRSFASLRPIMPPVAVAALLVVLTTALLPLTTLQALVYGMPVLCVATLAATGRERLWTAAKATGEGLGHLGPETCLLTVAVVLGVVLEDSLAKTDILAWLSGLGLSPLAVIAGTMGFMVLGGIAAIHPIVTGTVALVLFTSFPTGVADLVLMQATLFGWGMAAVVSLGSVSVATASAMFRIPPERLVTRGNMLMILVYGALTAFILDGINRLLTA